MESSPQHPTWQIFSDGGKHFRWKKVSPQAPSSILQESYKTLIPVQNTKYRLSSMPDLLIQGSSELLKTENIENGRENSPRMFQTASGKSVAVKHSSTRKASTVLGEGENAERELQEDSNGNCHESSPPMFQTASGKSVAVKQSSIRKALSVLREEEIKERGSSKCINDKSKNSTLFHTGLGKSVGVTQSSIDKALLVLGEDDTKIKECFPKHDGNHGSCFPNSLFQTGSGKAVNISSGGLMRAKTLLGLEENYNLCISEALQHTVKQPGNNKLDEEGNSESLEERFCGIHGTGNKHDIGYLDIKSRPKLLATYQQERYSYADLSKQDVPPSLLGSQISEPASKQLPILFQTAAEKSISVSSDALLRARGLLGEPQLGISSQVFACNPLFMVHKEEKICDENSSNKENISSASCLHQTAAMNNHFMNRSVPPDRSFSYQRQSCSTAEVTSSGAEIVKHLDENFLSEGVCRSNSIISSKQKALNGDLHLSHMLHGNSSDGVLSSRNPQGKSIAAPMVEISNNKNEAHRHVASEKRRLGKRSSISPFKTPRRSRFSTPLNSNISSLSTGPCTSSTSEGSCLRTRVSSRYPFQVKRKNVKEFFGRPPYHHNLLGSLPNEVKNMSAHSAEKFIFGTATGNRVGVEALQYMLVQSGASLLNATTEWVANHYKWIVWKLACLERGYPGQTSGKYLTVANVLEELKYRYEREVNHGHRSALKRILDGDVSPASMVVLCISAIHSSAGPTLGRQGCAVALRDDINKLSSSTEAETNCVATIELTDGWYSVDALLDAPLSQKVIEGKLFVGQKLRIWGAGLRGWVGPVSVLEASKAVTLAMHINGTYRAHWADRLGFCKGVGAPLAFRCIHGAGGVVPRTLVGVTRIYPILYKERLTNGVSVARSERMEAKMLQLYNQRRSIIAEGIMSEAQKDCVLHCKDDSDLDEGERIFKLLETSAEPEVVMADMSSDQLISFATYQAKRETIRQSHTQKKIEKALDDAGLAERHITPFMKVRVVGLTSKHSTGKECPRKGLITIWNPTEKQVDLVEGQIYCVGGLVPLQSDPDTIYLQARGSTTTWQILPSAMSENFEPFFTPRKPVLLSNLGEVPLSSEFDIAAVVVYVGDVYVSGNQKKQWVFLTDGSKYGTMLEPGESSNSLLAVSFYSHITDKDLLEPISRSFAGSVVSK